AEAAEAEAEGGDESAQSGAEILGLRVDAIALSESGQAALYSGTDGTVWRFDATRNSFVGGAAQLPEAAVGVGAAQIALVAGEWIVLNSETGEVWHEDGAEATIELSGAARLQASGAGVGAADSSALIADASGLWSVSRQGEVDRLLEA